LDDHLVLENLGESLDVNGDEQNDPRNPDNAIDDRESE
jgi:hypothetical protein